MNDGQPVSIFRLLPNERHLEYYPELLIYPDAGSNRIHGCKCL